MLFVLICTYLGVWSCAYAAARHAPGKVSFWLWFCVALGCVPLVSSLVLGWLFGIANPDYGQSIGPAAFQIGVGVAALVYPISYWRMRRGA